MLEFDARRSQLAEYISGFAAKTPAVRKAFLSVRREEFMPLYVRQYAYADDAIPIGLGQTISQPSTIAIMLELLGAEKGMKVLEVGSGCGYVLALLSHIVGREGKVFGVEIIGEHAEKSIKALQKQGIENAELKKGDGAEGWKEKAPFDRILVSCACPYVPKELFSQLAEGGRAVAPVGDAHTQALEIMVKKNGKPVEKTYSESLFAFVPLKGKHGFS